MKDKGRNAGFRETDDISDENTNPIPTPAPATYKDYLIKWSKPPILLVVSEVHENLLILVFPAIE